MSGWGAVNARATKLGLGASENTPAGKAFWHLLGIIQGYGMEIGGGGYPLDSVSSELSLLVLHALDYYEKKEKE